MKNTCAVLNDETYYEDDWLEAYPTIKRWDASEVSNPNYMMLKHLIRCYPTAKMQSLKYWTDHGTGWYANLYLEPR